MARGKLPSPTNLLRDWLHEPAALTSAIFAVTAVALGIAFWRILRNLRHNEPGLNSPTTFVLALVIAASGIFGASRLPDGYFFHVAAPLCALASGLFFFADDRRFVRDPAGTIVFDRWQIVLRFARFSWTRDKLNRHFFISGETGAGKTTGINKLMTELVRRQQGRRVVFPPMARAEIRT
jgi:Cdc6-like AAA superfamily ATPase